MKDLHELFEEAGISEQELVDYFLNPVFPAQNAAITDGVIFTEDANNSGESSKIEKGPVEDIIADNFEIFLKLLKNKNIEEDVFVEWLAHHETSSVDTKGESRDLKRMAKSMLSVAAASLLAFSSSLGASINKLLPTSEKQDTESSMIEGRVLAEEQMEENSLEMENNTEVMAKLNEAKLKEKTKELATEIDLVDAVYDNMDIIMDVKKNAEEIAKDQHATASEKKSATDLSKALKDPNKIKAVGITENNEIGIEYKDKGTAETQKLSNIIVVTGRIAAIRSRIANASAEARSGDPMSKALADAGGSLSLGTGGKDTDSIEKSKTPNDPVQNKDKTKTPEIS